MLTTGFRIIQMCFFQQLSLEKSSVFSFCGTVCLASRFLLPLMIASVARSSPFPPSVFSVTLLSLDECMTDTLSARFARLTDREGWSALTNAFPLQSQIGGCTCAWIKGQIKTGVYKLLKPDSPMNTALLMPQLRHKFLSRHYHDRGVDA